MFPHKHFSPSLCGHSSPLASSPCPPSCPFPSSLLWSGPRSRWSPVECCVHQWWSKLRVRWFPGSWSAGLGSRSFSVSGAAPVSDLKRFFCLLRAMDALYKNIRLTWCNHCFFLSIVIKYLLSFFTWFFHSSV